jgi:hypothetical protein
MTKENHPINHNALLVSGNNFPWGLLFIDAILYVHKFFLEDSACVSPDTATQIGLPKEKTLVLQIGLSNRMEGVVLCCYVRKYFTNIFWLLVEPSLEKVSKQ